jgi:hypothetical protein
MGGLRKLLQMFRKKSKRLWASGEALTTQEPNSPMQAIRWNENVQIEGKSTNADERIAAKPKDIVNEILCKDDEVKLDFSNLKAKIKAVEKRRDFMRDDMGVQTSDEEQALGYLNARLTLTKQKNAKTLFPWHITTQDKIDALCKKFKVSAGHSLSSYKRCIPQEALDVMEQYLKACRVISKKEPTILLIVDVGGQEQRKDPIVYATSPFGNYFYVLGAWDKEVEIIDELFLWK